MLRENDPPELLTWQIGSRKPPRVCLCCGEKFDKVRKQMGPYKGPYIWVCSECWEKPYLFFPDKIEGDRIHRYSLENIDDTRIGTKHEKSFYHNLESTDSTRDANDPKVVQGIYDWLLGENRYSVVRVAKPISDLRFNPHNQRIQYALRIRRLDPFSVDQETIEGVLQDVERQHLDRLYLQILQAGGLFQPLVVSYEGTVFEGNCRLAVLRKLCKDFDANSSFSFPPCEVLPDSFSEADMLVYLGDQHVASKQSWPTYEIAEHIYKMVKVHRRPLEFAAKSLRMSSHTVRNYINAYEMASEYLYDNLDSTSLNKWSYFYEFQKRKILRDKGKRNPRFKKRFLSWVREEKIYRGNQVRKLADLVDDAKALNALDKYGFDAAFDLHNRNLNINEDKAKVALLDLQRALSDVCNLPLSDLKFLASSGELNESLFEELAGKMNVMTEEVELKIQ